MIRSYLLVVYKGTGRYLHIFRVAVTYLKIACGPDETTFYERYAYKGFVSTMLDIYVTMKGAIKMDIRYFIF